MMDIKVAGHYERARRPNDPSEVLERDDWSLEQKRLFLQDWKLYLVELMSATDENMSGVRNGDAQAADMLRRVSAALNQIENSGGTSPV